MANKDIKISEILHLAADEYLWDGNGASGLFSQNPWYFSCDAIEAAFFSSMHENKRSCTFDVCDIRIGLYKLGLDIHSTIEFNEFETPEQRQGARYAWLKFAALLAEEQGV